FVISGKRIITNAHVVADHILVQVRKHGSPKKYKAEVKAIGRECDLAMLVIESEEFWEDMNPLELGDMPFRKESVVVVGYPQGGESISTTTGVVNRIESQYYRHGATNLPVQRLVPVDQSDNNSSYYIFAGLVFVPLSKQHIKGPNAMHRLAYNNTPKKAGGQVVIISEILADMINVEY
ncbi:unnamed protein product, partial [Microthlaspi erraticum]